jgi:hypothetical protein
MIVASMDASHVPCMPLPAFSCRRAQPGEMFLVSCIEGSHISRGRLRYPQGAFLTHERM